MASTDVVATFLPGRRDSRPARLVDDQAAYFPINLLYFSGRWVNLYYNGPLVYGGRGGYSRGVRYGYTTPP
jgi:hypothetical protein